MAYKNKGKNKKHTEKLNMDHDNWRNVKRRRQKISDAKIELRQIGLTEEECERLLKMQGLI